MVEALNPKGPEHVLEVGPGKGAVTRFLIGPDPQAPSSEERGRFIVSVVEVDKRMCDHLAEQFPQLHGRVFNEDFLTLDLDKIASGGLGSRPPGTSSPQFQLIGSFPYNISSQIVFRVLENRERVPVTVGMFQREVAKRIVARHGNKDYGILSVLTQTFFETQLLFTVKPGSFSPPPKVMSAVVRLRLKPAVALRDEAFFFKVVKAAFNQRRKMLRNSLSEFLPESPTPSVASALTVVLSKRPEQLSVAEFQELAEVLLRE